MAPVRFLLILIIAIALSGCIVNPVYFARDLIRLPGVEGTWEPLQEEGRDNPFANWEITAAKEGKYRITQNDGDNPRYYEGGFFKLDGILYLDIAGTRYNDRTAREEQGIHNILKMVPRDDTLRGQLMDLDYLDKGIRSKKYNLKYETVTDRSSDYNTGTTIYITASTAELQAFLIANSSDEKLFPPRDAIVLRRDRDSFNRYFPKESFDLQALQKAPGTPAMLKQTFTYGRKGDPLGLIDSLTRAPLLYRPAYFRAALFAMGSNPDEVDSAVARRVTAYVLSNTREFLHYFNGSPGGTASEMRTWADIVSQNPSPVQAEVVAQLQAAGPGWTGREQRMLAEFIKVLEDQYLRRGGPDSIRRPFR